MDIFLSYFIFIVIVFIAIIIKRKTPYLIGKIGEKTVSNKLLQLDATKYKVLNDLFLPYNGGLANTQIDHVVVSNYGIFCIETKAYKGWIFGNAEQEYWTQVIYKDKERFYNPIWQNYAHVKAVEELIRQKYKNVQVYSYIIFTEASKLQISNSGSVGNMNDIITKIKSYQQIQLSDTEKEDVCLILENANIIDKDLRKIHNQGVQEIKHNAF